MDRKDKKEHPKARRNMHGARGSSTGAIHKNYVSSPQHIRNKSANFDHKGKPKFRLGFKKLEEMIALDSENLVLKLANDKMGFSELLDEDLSPDYIVLVLSVISKMCQTSFDSNKATIMCMICKENFIYRLQSFVLEIPIQTLQDKRHSLYYWRDVNTFWQNLFICSEAIYNTIPSVAVDKLPKLLQAIILTVDHLEVSDEIKSKFQNLKIKLFMRKEEMKNKCVSKKSDKDEDSEPPDDFRNINLYPSVFEITNPKRSFVRENKVKGPYKNVNHYLDVQFRLMREDFVGPLRAGICEFLHDSAKRLQNIRIHQNVQFLNPELVNGVRGELLQFRPKSKKVKIKYEHSRKFMFGSLLCFTKDNFISLIFGKIIDRKTERLEIGQLIVGFEPNTKIEYNNDYLMVECNIYFEPYYHVLFALQNMNENEFPMKKYLVDVTHENELPNYIINENLLIGNRTVNVSNHIWPSAIALKLNDTQYKAYKASLSQQLSIIQGPPGTGKTYLGLRIAKTLLSNADIWYKKSPMLIVCYTNHALDQFLEGLCDTTKEIIRFGGQSKNEKLEPYNIKQMRSRHSSNVKELLWQKRRELEIKLDEVNRRYSELNAVYGYEGVINISHFVKLIPELNNTWFSQITVEEFQNWLLGARSNKVVQEPLVQIPKQTNVNNDSSDDDSDVEEMFKELNLNDQEENDDLSLPLLDSIKYAFKLSEMDKQANDIQTMLNNIAQNSPGAVKLMFEHETLKHAFNYVKMRLEEGRRYPQTRRPYLNLQFPQRIDQNNRWRLYFYWLHLYEKALREVVFKAEKEYQMCNMQYEEVRNIQDIYVMREKLVVGMTTTCAAKLHKSLLALKSPIVIVEEAAEIMEPHVITALTHHCQHLILIGDHQQLRPSTADYTMENKYMLGISLFERMIRNDLNCNVLGIQHRMRPEFAQLIVPAIYPNLKNHVSVLDRPPIRGVDSNLYFITHTNREDQHDDDKNSKSNVHEVKYLLQLAKYLLLNGYQPEDITILAAYTAQMFLFWRHRKNFNILKDVRITVLDNYQGEESKIILLSLVRNNADGKIGFLSIENRVCVALSRARDGFYIMGNIELLCSNSRIWPKVRVVLESQKALGTSLNLRCQNHPNMISTIKTAEDFFKVSEGGCSKLCGLVLNCGHDCKMQCHTYNRDHNEYKCKEDCKKILCESNHRCPKYCYEDCGQCDVPIEKMLDCGHKQFMPCQREPKDHKCNALVSTELQCNHTVNKQCHADVETYPCPFPCDTRIDKCGHACRFNCHVRNDPDHLQYKCMKPCARYKSGCTVQIDTHICHNLCCQECPPCDIPVNKKRTICSHVYEVQCSENVDEIICKKACKKSLPCGHFCKLKCCESCGNCNVKVKKVLPECKHEVTVKCCEEPTRNHCLKKCPRKLSCGHYCKNKCKEECTKFCKVLVDNPVESPCGHIFKIPCGLKLESEVVVLDDAALLQYCSQPCHEILECGHSCSGSCSECYQGRIHKTCMQKCGVVLVCGHNCTTPCRETCQPCNERCTYMCKHSKCKKKCGEPCTPCKEACPRICVHIECTSKCGDICNVPPCNKPCTKMLPCQHQCIGFCGDPCPPLCLICNRQELIEDFVLGFEDEEGARFVLLQECGHVIESEGMENWLQAGDDQVNVKRCPRCNTPLTFTHRYNNYIKKSINNVIEVKKKFYGTPQSNESMRRDLLKELDDVVFDKLINRSTECLKLKHYLEVSLQPIRNSKRQPMNSLLAKTIKSKMQIFQQICTLYNDKKREVVNAKTFQYVSFLLRTLRKREIRITNQEINDFKREIKKYERMLQLAEIEHATSVTTAMKSNAKMKELYLKLSTELYSTKRYNMEDDVKIKKDLQELSKLTSAGLDINSREFQEIIRAVGVQSGAWYKCPNNHYYAIGDCGGAMEVSKCIECKAEIGGANHRLLTTNRHAGDVDNSRHAAWTEAANMLNYNL